jgi:carbamoyl-phosphate synthase large subunit
MITVCFIENIDAVGVHTGDSICSAPMLTISDELQKRLQKYSYDVVEAIDVIGGTNVQFAHDPKTGRVVIIEINPRTSRSSALASKATGFPIAYVSSLLAAGLTLDEIPYWRDGTLDKYTPSGDYVVIKFPRWAFEKFPGSIDKLGTQMRAVGEVMSIGKNYKEAMQKAIRSLEIGRYGLGFAKDFNEKTLDELLVLLAEPSSERQFILYEALRKGADVDSLYSLTYIKPYFLEQMKELVQFEEELLKHRGADLPDELLIKAKKEGFADRYLSKLLGLSEYEIREKRTKIGAVEGWEAVPVSGVENASYYFSTYNAPDTTPVSNQKKVMILGGGPNRIGQGIEFDYCCVHAAYTLKDLGYETVMVNCNPETVSTDYDTSDKLYFEPLTVEDVLSIYEKEKPEGIIVSFGGQTPLNIAGELEKAGVKILGTSQVTIDLAEDRDLFRNIMEKLDIPMPESGMAVNVEEAIEIAHRIGYPLMVRPSYVLGGRGMKVVHDDEMLRQYMVSAVGVTKDRPILVDRFLKDATEAEADAIADGKDAFVPTVMEHIEYAGIHSGDSACVIPPISIGEEHLKTIVEYTKKIAKEMKVVGLMNMQYAIEGDTVYVLEANPRGSRTVPLVSKVCNIPMASIATEIIMAVNTGENYDMSLLVNKNIPHYGVKEAVLPFNMFPEVHPVLGPEMRSTGEVLGMADSFELAYVKAQESTSFPLPTSGTVLISVNDNDKQEVLKAARVFMEIGFKIRATKGTCAFLQNSGVNCEEIKKLHEGRPNISDSIYNNEIKLIINTPSSRISEFDDISICMLAVRHKVPYITTMTAAFASAKGIKAYIENNMPLSMIRSLQEYHANIE